MKIAICGIGSENCTFSPDRLGRDAFRLHVGIELQKRFPFIDAPDFIDLDIVPLVMARALPGGPIRVETYEELCDLILQPLIDGGPWDGVHLDLHGAMYVEGHEDVEADFASRIASVVGPDCTIGASFDLHGNISPRLIEQIHVLSAYRTAPHEDEEETRERAFRMLTDSLRRKKRPARAWIRVPVLLPGEVTSTQYDPGKSLYADLSRVENEQHIKDLSLWAGYAWADEPRSSATVVATGYEEQACIRAAKEIAQRFWNAREDFDFGMPALPFAECLQQATITRRFPAIIGDSGDNPTAGGVGNLVIALRETLDAADTSTDILIAGIWDKTATAACFDAGENQSINLEIGTHMPSDYGPPVRATGQIVRLHEGDPHAHRQAVVATGDIRIILCEERKPFHHLADFTQLGIDPAALHVLIVKMGYLVPELLNLAKSHWLALTPGAVDQDIQRLPYQNIRHPMFPMDRNFEWTPEPIVFES